MRLIDAEKLNFAKVFYGDYWTELLPKYQVDIAKTIDAEPIVRCKDCKYYLNSNEECQLINTRLRFYEMNKRWTEECFCGWAERKEDE